MYCRLLEEAVHELSGTSSERLPEPSIDLNINAFISDNYISDSAVKIEVYKKIMHIENQEDSFDVVEELVDRFGDIPSPVENLISIARIKSLAARTGVQSIVQTRDSVSIRFHELSGIKAEQLAPITEMFKRRVSYSAAAGFQIILSVKNLSGPEVLRKLEELLAKLAGQAE